MGITEEHIERIKKHAETMEGFAVAAVNVSSELDAVLRDNQQMERQIERLNEANARLRERLNRGENHDAYMKLPLDADGVPIRLKDWVWYVGIDAEITKDDPQQVVGFVSDLGMNGIYAVTRDYPDKAISPKMLTHRAPESPDSWEKLEEDAKKDACELAGKGGSDDCVGCKWFPMSNCNEMARLEILKRAKKLAGIEEAQR